MSKLASCAFGYWKITLLGTNPEWWNGSCTCPVYYKRYVCKHLAGIAILQKLLLPSYAAKNQPLGVKRGPGRPTLAKLALIRMPRESILDYGNLSTDEDAGDDEIFYLQFNDYPSPLVENINQISCVANNSNDPYLANFLASFETTSNLITTMPLR